MGVPGIIYLLLCVIFCLLLPELVCYGILYAHEAALGAEPFSINVLLCTCSSCQAVFCHLGISASKSIYTPASCEAATATREHAHY